MELAVWTHYILYDLKPELLEDMPTSKVEAAPAATAGMNFHNSFKQNQYLKCKPDIGQGINIFRV